jgi:hypothetical protein
MIYSFRFEHIANMPAMANVYVQRVFACSTRQSGVAPTMGRMAPCLDIENDMQCHYAYRDLEKLRTVLQSSPAAQARRIYAGS